MLQITVVARGPGAKKAGPAAECGAALPYKASERGGQSVDDQVSWARAELQCKKRVAPQIEICQIWTDASERNAKVTDSAVDYGFRDEASRWIAVTSRDKSADGVFWYGVKSTGVYCRPHCPSKPARRENVTFYTSIADAELHGYRPCKRCKPDRGDLEDANAAAIATACRLIEQAEEPLVLEVLAQSVGMSPFHFHRTFKAVTGVTPKQYAMGQRGQRVAEKLAGKGSVTTAIYDGGFNSPSRFYAKAEGMLGMKPSTYKRGGIGENIQFHISSCSLGYLLVAATGKGICSIRFGDTPMELQAELNQLFPQAHILEGDAEFSKVVSETLAFVEQPGAKFNLPLDIRGTAFQQRVWAALQKIPLGKTASYQDVAKSIGNPAAVRAVAGACAANPVAVAVPCHRVVKADGALSGYRWGVGRKEKLLKREGAR
jgi:AraC family transcriptional regulator, regulatory protein of adaptative response / methylated-DNA-[protein]-cysteine methyltransferase